MMFVRGDGEVRWDRVFDEHIVIFPIYTLQLPPFEEEKVRLVAKGFGFTQRKDLIHSKRHVGPGQRERPCLSAPPNRARMKDPSLHEPSQRKSSKWSCFDETSMKARRRAKAHLVISSKKRKMNGFTPRLMDQEMNERLEDPAQGEKSQWDAFAERNRDAAATKVLTWEADLDLKRSVTIIQKEKDRTKEGGDDGPRMGF
nr:hypothetical protein [Tanacetum cinerariifolium]